MNNEDLYHFIASEEHNMRLMNSGFSREEAEMLANRRELELQEELTRERILNDNKEHKHFVNETSPQYRGPY